MAVGRKKRTCRIIPLGHMSPSAEQKLITRNKLTHLTVVGRNLKRSTDLVCRSIYG